MYLLDLEGRENKELGIRCQPRGRRLRDMDQVWGVSKGRRIRLIGCQERGLVLELVLGVEVEVELEG